MERLSLPWNATRLDLRYAFRSWRRTPAIPAIALTALTFGMGANIAIFSAVHAVLLRPLPVPEPGQLVLLRETNAARGLEPSAASLPNYLSWKEQARTVELAAFSGQTLTWTGPEYPERLEALAPTASFQAVLGAPLLIGRWFTEDEERPGEHRVAVLSNRLWRTRFGADPGVIGRQLVLNAAPYTIVGVASPEFSVPSEPDLWVPQVVDPATARRGNRYLAVVGRLRPGVTPGRAQAEMTSIAIGLEQQFQDTNRDFRVSVVPWAESLVPAEVRTALVVLLAAAAVVLLIACANVANVLLSRAMSYLVAQRTHEFGIRMALGARPSRLPLVVVGQGLRYTLAGIALGLFAAVLVIDRIQSLLFDVDAYDPATFGAVAFAVAGVALTASYIPARRAATVDPLVVLRAE